MCQTLLRWARLTLGLVCQEPARAFLNLRMLESLACFTLLDLHATFVESIELVVRVSSQCCGSAEESTEQRQRELHLWVN